MDTMDAKDNSSNRRATPARWSRSGSLVLAILGVGAFLASCRSSKPSQSTSFFPDSNEVQGWTRTGETRTFPADKLWEYIDGDADKYVQAGVERTLTTDYRYGEKVEAVADVYVMSAANGAQKVFDSESSNGSQAVQVGDAARLYQGSLIFRKGRYFVRLVAYQESPGVGSALVALGHGVERHLSN